MHCKGTLQLHKKKSSQVGFYVPGGRQNKGKFFKIFGCLSDL
jgi:hypothetical protein